MKQITNELPTEPYGPIYNRLPAYQNGPNHIETQMVQTGVEAYEGDTIEQRVEKIMNNNEPITDGATQLFTDRADGVIPEYDVRTDKWDQAIDMTTEISKRKFEARQKRIDERIKGKAVEKTPDPTPSPTTSSNEPK